MRCPRVLISGTSSASGKTTAVCAVIALLKRRGLDVKAFKCGPDYLDPTFHETVTGVACTNLDPFFCDADQLRRLLCENSGRDISVVEGVMGFYDGTGFSGTENSTYSVSQMVKAPVILVVPAKGASTSLLAVIEGFLSFAPENGIRGVLFSGISPSTYQMTKQLMRQRFDGRVVPIGFIPNLPEDCTIPSRHLGLVSAQEIDDMSARLDKIADICEDTIDIGALVSIAENADEISYTVPETRRHENVSIAVAKDQAFFFYYHDFLDLLVRMGAQINYFSPLADEPVPQGAHGLIIGGGYPELHARQLEANNTARRSVLQAVSSGLPTIAECGGFQYLGRRLEGRAMCGALGHDSYDCKKLVRFGYVTLTSKRDGLFGKAGTVLRGHEFHYYDSTEVGEDFVARKPNGKEWTCAFTTETLYAGYPHLHLSSSIPAVESFYDKCLQYKRRQK